MRFYRFEDPLGRRFAEAGVRGTWATRPGWKFKGLCPECTLADEERVRPLVIEWEPGSDLVGDFTYPGIGDVMISDRVRALFEARGFKGFEIGHVEMLQDPRLKRPRQMTGRSKRRVWLPYEGTPLWDLWVTAYCTLDLEQSGVELEKQCGSCGEKYYDWPREGYHFVVERQSWQGGHILKISEFPLQTYMTEEVKEAIEQAGSTNFGCREWGVIPE